MKKPQLGVTLIELMIIVAIIAVLSALAYPAYTDYTIRAQISEGLHLAGGAKVAVAEYYQGHSQYPSDNAQAGLATPGSITGRYVDSVFVNGPVVSIQYGNAANAQIIGQTITLTAVDSLGSVRWVCATAGIIQLGHLPTGCR